MKEEYKARSWMIDFLFSYRKMLLDKCDFIFFWNAQILFIFHKGVLRGYSFLFGRVFLSTMLL